MKRKQAHKQGLLRDFYQNQWELLATFAKSSCGKFWLSFTLNANVESLVNFFLNHSRNIVEFHGAPL